MVNSQNIINLKACLKTLLPPGITAGLMLLPVINRISPKLSKLCKGIRRAACNLKRHAFFIQLKELRMSPYIGRVCCNINRNITNNSNIIFCSIISKCIPLLKEKILQHLVIFDAALTLLCPFLYCSRLAHSDIFFPLKEGNSIVGILYCHKKSIIIQPESILFAECLKIGRSLFLKIILKLCKKLVALYIKQSVINIGFIISPVDFFIISF